MDHPVLIPGSPFNVRWLRHTDGRCHGQEFYEATPACKVALLAQARQMSVKGRVAKQPENGHPLKGKYRDLYEMKPGDFRFMVFRHGNDFYITNGAPKKERNKQVPDYEHAQRMKTPFMASAKPRRHG